MPYRPHERSVSDELALLQDLAASRRMASFKALMARHQRTLRPGTAPATPSLPPDLPRELPVPTPTPDSAAD